jgi:hypothetical protein
MALPDIVEPGSLGVYHLKRYWARTMEARRGEPPGASEWTRDKTLLFGLGVGLHETIQFLLGNAPSFEEFENWILERNGGSLDQTKVARLNAALTGRMRVIRRSNVRRMSSGLWTWSFGMSTGM